MFKESSLADKNEITIVDFGSGKSYLTFALYDYFNERLGVKADINGVEQRKDLAELSNKTEECGFENLKFKESTISVQRKKL